MPPPNLSARQIYARRRHNTETRAAASRKRDMPLIELTPDEEALLRRSDKLEAEWRAAEAKQGR